MVSSRPRCPAVGVSCHTCMIRHFSELFRGMTRHCLLVSFQKVCDVVSMGVMGYVSSHSFIIVSYWVWHSVIIDSNDPSELASASRMNVFSGRIVIC